jgi:hypothetical protein
VLLNKYQQLRRRRPLAERLKGILLSWPLSSDRLLPYTMPEVRDGPTAKSVSASSATEDMASGSSNCFVSSSSLSNRRAKLCVRDGFPIRWINSPIS